MHDLPWNLTHSIDSYYLYSTNNHETQKQIPGNGLESPSLKLTPCSSYKDTSLIIEVSDSEGSKVEAFLVAKKV